MNLIEPSVTLIEEPDMLRRIELCGRVSYKSEDKITEGSAKKFVNVLITRGHESPLEHSNICIQTQDASIIQGAAVEVTDSIYRSNPIYLRIDATGSPNYIISGNVRSWRNFVRCAVLPTQKQLANKLILSPKTQTFFFDFQPYKIQATNGSSDTAEPVEIDILEWAKGKKHNILTFRFVCSRAVSHELVRHRLMAITQESQRYVDTSNVSVIKPTWMDHEHEFQTSLMRTPWTKSAIVSENMYRDMLNAGAQKQQARDVLTNACKTEVVMTGTIPMWEHFFELRCDKAAYPEIRVLADQAKAIYESEKARTKEWTVQ